MRIERLLAAGGSIKAAARKFAIDYHALRLHWRNLVSAEARAVYVAGAGPSKDQLEAIVADESLALIDHYRIVRGALCKGLSAASELGDGNAVGLLAGRERQSVAEAQLAAEELVIRVLQPARAQHLGRQIVHVQTAKNVFLWPGRDWLRKGIRSLVHGADR